MRRREALEGGTQEKQRGLAEENVERWSSKKVQHCSICKKAGHRRTKCPDLSKKDECEESTIPVKRSKLAVRRAQGAQAEGEEGEKVDHAQGTQGKQEDTIKMWGTKKVQHYGICKKVGHRRPKCPELTKNNEGKIEGESEVQLEGETEGQLEGQTEGEEEGQAEGEDEGQLEGEAEGEEEGQTEGEEEGQADHEAGEETDHEAGEAIEQEEGEKVVPRKKLIELTLPSDEL